MTSPNKAIPLNSRRAERLLLPILFPPRNDFPSRVRCLKHIAYFPKLNIAFNRVKKNTSSTSIGLLSYLEKGEMAHAMAVKGSTPHIDELGLRGLFLLRRALRIVVVRDPYSRLLSAFLDKFRSEDYRAKYGRFDLNRSGFQDFLAFLENGGLRSNQHWGLQTEQIALPIEEYQETLTFSGFPNNLLDVLTPIAPHVRDLAPRVSGPDAGAPSPTRATEKLAAFYDTSTLGRVDELFVKDLQIEPIADEAHKTVRSLWAV